LKKKPSFLCALLIPFLVIALANIQVRSSSTARIYVDPPIAYKEKDASLKVDIKIADVLNLYSWQVNMSFNPSVLEFFNVTEGYFLKDQPEGTLPVLRKDKAQEGWVLFSWATIGKYLGVSGGGTLATVEFIVGEGESLINLDSPRTNLVEIHPPPVPPGGTIFTEIPHTAENGFFTNLVDPPTANFTVTPSLPNINQPITFDASASYATAPRVIDSYRWDFGDNTTEIYVKDENLTSTTTHTYTTSETFTVSLTVTDNATATDLVQTIFGTTTMPRIWYEIYSKNTTVINIKFGHDVAVTNVIPSEAEVTAGEAVSINVTVLNKGTETESFSVTAYYGDNMIETKQVADLASEGEETLIFDWDTTGVAAKKYQMRAEATLEGDGYPEDNMFTDGTVTVHTSTESFPTWIVGAVVAVAVLAVIVLLYVRRRRSPPQ